MPGRSESAKAGGVIPPALPGIDRVGVASVVVTEADQSFPSTVPVMRTCVT